MPGVPEKGMGFTFKNVILIVNMEEQNMDSTKPTEKKTLPEPKDFFLKTSLYEPFEIYEEDTEKLFNIVFYKGIIDTYCISCEKKSTFKSVDNYVTRHFMVGSQPAVETYNNVDSFKSDYFLETKVFSKEFICTRKEKHKMVFHFFIDDNKITKIGQYPSLATLTNPDTKKYRRVLKEKHDELNKAIGLFAHGVGIGSFVYLRRIFEDLIEGAHAKAKNESMWDETLYKKQRMNGKIATLKDYLPDFLVEKKETYSILSKGIHELSEDECLNIFPVVKVGIELILDEKLEELEKQRKINEARVAISKTHQKTK